MEFEWLRVNVVVYIEGYIFVFLMLRIRGLSMSCFVLHSLRNQNKNKKKFAADAVGWLMFFSFDSFLRRKERVSYKRSCIIP